jgi:hypothetical protein
LTLFYGSKAKASPENTKISITLIGHPMGMTMQHPRPWLLPHRIIRPSSAGYPESANKKRLTTTVRVTLNTTLTTNQNRQPLPTL